VEDWEKRALGRDKRFLARLVVSLIIAVLLGMFIFIKLTSHDVGQCAARGFSTVSHE